MKQKHSINRPRLPRTLSKLPGKLSKPTLPDSFSRRLTRAKNKGNPLEDLGGLPRITNETVAEHREQVLRGARKYIYPLQHSRAKVVKVSIGLFVVAIIAFFGYCLLALYKYQSTSTFIYEVSRVIPFPVAKVGPQFVSYESYLFELRHLTHYYQDQQKQNFKDPRYADQLVRLKQDSMKKVVNDAYVKQLAKTNNISVSSREVQDQIALVKAQNRLGSNDQMLSDVLKQFWGWSIDDFEDELKTQLLSQKVASELDTATHARADNALAALQGGANFAVTAKAVSDDAGSKANGGQYPGPVGKTDRDVPPRAIDALFKLQPGQTSGIVDTGYTLEIVKNNAVQGEKIQASHIQFKLQPIDTYVKPLAGEQKVRHFIKI